MAIPRLGIPATVQCDGPAGVHIDAHREGDSRNYYATGFPVGTCLASTWNTDLVRKVGEAIDIYVNNRLVARGEVVVVEDRLGITMTEIIKAERT